MAKRTRLLTVVGVLSVAGCASHRVNVENLTGQPVTSMTVKTQADEFDFNYGTVVSLPHSSIGTKGYDGPMKIDAHDTCVVSWIDQKKTRHETTVYLRETHGLTGGWLFSLIPTNTVVVQRVVD